jgi:hypothetical protein
MVENPHNNVEFELTRQGQDGHGVPCPYGVVESRDAQLLVGWLYATLSLLDSNF